MHGFMNGYTRWISEDDFEDARHGEDVVHEEDAGHGEDVVHEEDTRHGEDVINEEQDGGHGEDGGTQ